MPTLAIGSSEIAMQRLGGPQSGFSLVEVLMTVFVLAIAASVIVVTLPKGTSPVMREAKRFEGVVSFSMRQALVGGVPVGLKVSKTGYVVTVWQGEEWQSLPDTEYHLPDNMQLAGGPEEVTENMPEDWPSVVFHPLSGTDVSFFVLRHAQNTVEIAITTDGRAILERGDG